MVLNDGLQQPQPQQTHQAAFPVAMPASQAPLQQQPQKLVLQGHQTQLPVIQSAPQATVSALSTSNGTIALVFNPVLSPFNPSTMASHTRIQVELLSKDIWKLFHGLQNEMSVNNSRKDDVLHSKDQHGDQKQATEPMRPDDQKRLMCPLNNNQQED